MKKIKSLKQLQAEKLLLQQRQEALENKIRENWKALKEQLKPVNIAKDAMESILHKKASTVMNDGGIINSSLSYGISLLVGKLAEAAGKKLCKILDGEVVSNEQVN